MMRILLVDDERSSRESVSQFLSELGHQIVECSNGQEAFMLLSSSPFPMVLSDIFMPKMNGLELLKKMKTLPNGKKTDLVIITGHGDVNTAIEALRSGAYDYLKKPINVNELAAVVARIAEHQTLLTENRELTEHFDQKVEAVNQAVNQELSILRQAFAESVGIGNIGVFSSAMKEVLSLAHKLHEDRDIPVLIEGETGTGKELVSRLVHYGDGKPAGSLIEINCSAISPALFENELFGHDPFAFTGANRKVSKGKLELAEGGTLFLDEIGDMPLELQPKLLRVLQEREFYRVGGTRKVQVDIRFVCATNQNLLQRVEKGLFRQDLYYRLNVGKITVPPLRERKEEISPLAEMFLKACSLRKQRKFVAFSPEAIRMLEEHPWPGNVRELQNVIDRLVLLHNDEIVRAEYLSLMEEEPHSPSLSSMVSNTFSLQAGSFSLPSDRLDIEHLNREIIKKALDMHQGNKTRTAAYLGITRHVLLSRLRNL